MDLLIMKILNKKMFDSIWKYIYSLSFCGSFTCFFIRLLVRGPSSFSCSLSSSARDVSSQPRFCFFRGGDGSSSSSLASASRSMWSRGSIHRERPVHLARRSRTRRWSGSGWERHLSCGWRLSRDLRLRSRRLNGLESLCLHTLLRRLDPLAAGVVRVERYRQRFRQQHAHRGQFDQQERLRHCSAYSVPFPPADKRRFGVC